MIESNESSIILGVERVDIMDERGNVTRHVLMYRQEEAPEVNFTVYLHPNMTRKHLVYLDTYTVYDMVIVAENGAGVGPNCSIDRKTIMPS